MNLRKEHVVLGGTLGILGVLYYASSNSPGAVRGSSKSGAPPEFEEHRTPDVSLALPAARKLDDFDRDVFAPPRDTRPLPALEMDEPPLPEFTGLVPPPEPAFDAALFGKFLRASATPTNVPGLFVAAEAEMEDSEPQAAPNAAPVAAPSIELLTPDQRSALIQSFKKLYDWMRLEDGEPVFGQIRNGDRYGLRARPGEDLLFVEVRPETGQERFPGQKPVAYKRARVTEFAFADTPSNRIQQRKREFEGQTGPSQLADMLAFADQCIELRLQAREALPTAEALFRKVLVHMPDDPAPRLGLARCYEAGFRFQDAYFEYVGREGEAQALIEKFAHRPEVHVALAELEARLRLFESAEQRFLHAEQIGGRAQWQVEHAFGTFLFERGRFDEALPRFKEAFRFEPTAPEAAKTRARIRTDLGNALLASGAIDEALASFDRALQADAGDQRARAGKLAALGLGAKGTAPAASTQATGVVFELAMSRALADLAAKNWTAARDGLLLAASADPLRAPRAWRALSWLAELTGYPADASRFIELALEGDPIDPWSLYQAGRLAAQRDDVQGAHDMFVRALDRELDFVDALVALGVLAYRSGDHAAAERYFERALAVDHNRAEVHALRGVNSIDAGDLLAARTSFEAGLALDPSHPLARAGQAWTTYRSGDSEKAITQFAELNDERRSQPESDPFRVHAKAQMARIHEHESKVVWSDAFERLQLKNDWDVEEAAGPLVALADGTLRIEGTFNSNGSARVLRQYGGSEFVAIELDVTVPSSCNAKVGLFVSKEKRLGNGQNQAESKFGIARRRDGGLVVLTMDTATADEAWEDVPAAGAPWWPTDRAVRLRIEKIGEGNEARGRISIDGIPVREGFKLPRLASSTKEVKVGVFAEGQTGLPAKVIIDNVEVTKRIRN